MKACLALRTIETSVKPPVWLLKEVNPSALFSGSYSFT